MTGHGRLSRVVPEILPILLFPVLPILAIGKFITDKSLNTTVWPASHPSINLVFLYSKKLKEFC